MTHRDTDSRPSSQTDTDVSGMQSAWQVALQQYDRAADLLNLGPAVRDVLRYPKREITVHFPVQLDDGTSRIFRGYRVWHNIVRRCQRRRHVRSEDAQFARAGAPDPPIHHRDQRHDRAGQ